MVPLAILLWKHKIASGDAATSTSSVYYFEPWNTLAAPPIATKDERNRSGRRRVAERKQSRRAASMSGEMSFEEGMLKTTARGGRRVPELEGCSGSGRKGGSRSVMMGREQCRVSNLVLA